MAELPFGGTNSAQAFGIYDLPGTHPRDDAPRIDAEASCARVLVPADDVLLYRSTTGHLSLELMGKFVHVDPVKASSGMRGLEERRSADDTWHTEQRELERLDEDIRRQRDRDHEAATTGHGAVDTARAMQRGGAD